MRRSFAWGSGGFALAAAVALTGGAAQAPAGEQAPISPVLQARGHRDGIWSIAFSPDGQRLASCGKDRTVKVWDVRGGRRRR